MRVEGHAVYEEAAGGQLLADLAGYGPGTTRGYGIDASGDAGAGSA
jgi:hypothetical protein